MVGPEGPGRCSVKGPKTIDAPFGLIWMGWATGVGHSTDSSPHPVILDIFHREFIWFFLGGCQQLLTYGIPFTSLSIHVVRSIFGVAGFRPASRATFDSAKVAKTMLAVMWPFGSPARFADSGGVQTRYAQTMPAFSPVSAARLGNTIRPGETAETMSLLIMEGQLHFAQAGPAD